MIFEIYFSSIDLVAHQFFRFVGRNFILYLPLHRAILRYPRKGGNQIEINPQRTEWSD